MRGIYIAASLLIALPLHGLNGAPNARRHRGEFTQDTVFAAPVVAAGEKIFLGKAGGGLCHTCHGTNAKGVKGLGPNLLDETWLHVDGSYASIVTLIESGVSKPKQSSAPMPPKGGSALNAEQLRAVAAYVYSLRQRK